MKKLILLLFIPLVFACSEDEDNNNQNSELIGTYSFIIGYEGFEEEDWSWYGYDCPTDYFEFTDSLFLIGFTDTDDCSDTNYWEEYSSPYEVLSNTSQEIEVIITGGSSLFIFNKSTQILRRYINLDGLYPSTNNWDILEVWQKD